MQYRLKLRAYANGIRNNEIKSLPTDAPQVYDQIETDIRNGVSDLSVESMSLTAIYAELRDAKDPSQYYRTKAELDKAVRWFEAMSRLGQWRLVVTGGLLGLNTRARRVEQLRYASFIFGFCDELPPPSRPGPEVICDYLSGDVTH